MINIMPMTTLNYIGLDRKVVANFYVLSLRSSRLKGRRKQKNILRHNIQILFGFRIKHGTFETQTMLCLPDPALH
jgi:hypothetical protein